MGSPRLKLGIAGLGKMGQLHLKKAVNNSKIEITGIYDIDLNKGFRIGSEWGLRACRSYEELLFDSDAIIISTSTESHFPLAIKALNHQVALFIEKPICESVEKVESLLRLAKEKSIPIQTGFVERFCWKKLLESRPWLFNKRPQLISTERCSSTPSRDKGLDIVSDLMIHDIDFVLWSLSEPPISIAAEGVSVGVSPIDIAFARLEFASGAIAYLKAAWVLTENKRMTQLSWGDGLLSFDLSHRKAQFTSTEKQIDEICLHELDPLSEQMNSFIQAAISQSPCVVDGWDGLKAIEISDLIKRKILDRNTSTTVLTERERKFLLKSWSTDVS